jgi:hypothetical protein
LLFSCSFPDFFLRRPLMGYRRNALGGRSFGTGVPNARARQGHWRR